jgi:hypothetical protein
VIIDKGIPADISVFTAAFARIILPITDGCVCREEKQAR